MPISISIFSQRHDKQNDLYTDYSTLINQLPIISFDTKLENEDNLFFQGIVKVEDISFIDNLLRELSVSAIITPINDGLVMTILDGDDSEEN